MQQTGVFCKELTPTKAEHLMNRARKELNKLEKVIKSKKQRAEKRRSSPDQEQSNSKAEVNVSSLVKAKKNEMCVPEEHGLEINKVKEKKKKHKSKCKDYSCEKNELNNTLSLGLRVNIELANENNDMALNPKHIKTLLMKHGNQDSPLRLKEKTEKVKSDENKKQKGVRQVNTKSISKTCQKLVGKESPEEIAENEENLEKNKIDLTLSATVIKTDKRKKLKAMNEFKETICATKHKKKKSRRESKSLEETICPEETESSQSKRHKNDRNYDSSTFQLQERKMKTREQEHTDSLFETKTEHKSKRKKKKHKDIQSEDVDKQSEERKHKNCNKDKEESHMDFSDTMKKTKRRKARENTENWEDSYNGVDYNESVTARKDEHQHSRDIENVNESLTLNFSHRHKKKKKKHKDTKESFTSFTEASYGELENNTEETNITETDSYYTSQSPTKRKRTKHKTGAFELEVQDTEVCNKKKTKEKVAEISNGCTVDKLKKKRHREESEESELIDLRKKSKKRKSTEEEVMHSVQELTESKRKKESKHVKEDELTALGYKSTKHKKKGGKEYKDVANTDYISENIQESNSNESVSLLGQGKKVKKKRRRLDESDAVQNVLVEGEHQIENMPDIDSVAIDKSNEQLGRHNEESIVTASDCENGQMKKKKKKKKKSKERERAEINSEVMSEIDSENASQNVSPLMTHVPSKANTTFGPSVMERLLYGDPNPVVTETCTYCTQCSHDATAKPSSVPPVDNTTNVKQEMSSIPKLQDEVEKPCVVENIMDTVVIKKEPGLGTENSNSDVIEPIIVIDVNNLKIKQEPGLETETPPDQASDSMELKLHKDHEQQIGQIEIKKEPGTETQNNLNAAVPSMDMMPAPEAEQQLPHLKKEHVMEQPNLNTEGASAVSNTPPEDTYLNSVISAEDGAPEFFRHASKSTNNIAVPEYHSVSVEKTLGQAESSSTAAEVSKVESANNVPDNVGYVATHQQQDLSKHQLSSKEASINSEGSSVQRVQTALREEWIYEFHLVDVPHKVPFGKIARYFGVPMSKVREYGGYGRRPQYKHVVVVLNHYTTCLRMSKKRRLFGSRHTFIWTFKNYVSQDSR